MSRIFGADRNPRNPDLPIDDLRGGRCRTSVKADKAPRKGSKPIESIPHPEIQNSSYKKATQRINEELRVPPFLAWPTTYDDKKNEVDSQSPNEASLKAGLCAASLVVWQKGNHQTTICANSIPRKHISDVYVKLDSKVLTNPPSRLEEFIQYLETYGEGGSESYPPSPTSSFQNTAFNREVSGQDVLLWQVARLSVVRNIFANGVKTLAGQFVPKHCVYPLVDRCWGSISIVDQVKAISHPRLAHVSKRSVDVEHTSESLEHWVVSTVDADLEIATERLLKFLETLNRRVQKLLSRAVDMRQSVANGSQELNDGYYSRSTLVKAAEKIFQFLYYSAYNFNVHCELGFAPAGPRLLAASQEHVHDKSGAEIFATLADLAMSKARDDLLLMTHTGDDAGAIFHFKASAQFTIDLGLSELMGRPLMWDMSILELYRDHLSALRFKASRKPSKTVLRELYLLDEEIEVVASVYMQQYKTEYNLWKVLGVNEIETKRDWRDEYVENLFSQFRNDLEKAAKALRHNIEITDEGNSKAILIFTLATIIFLPLSFIASVFGMNTSDIRDMNSNQALFWAIALPVTATIGAISLVAAYGNVSIVDRIRKLKNNVTMKRPTTQLPWKRIKHKTDEERADDPNIAAIAKRERRFNAHRSDLWLHSKRWPSRRQKTNSHDPRVLVRTATGKTLHTKPKRRVREADALDSSERH
ncbi:hypothetical protein COCMIDRAFT_34980 [Bipolaris oryzae ATCC 44560]|uniref:Uncharacterized protein n=1 Tax=Bipolaris oryzae ATCC 44560 TaxID=930090 RepID=W6ZUJ0_COCMI|nr:uncharacterized protein COCMIDRAFT_34980 [Bipolaris oryzae ATCC 44560]EUC47446.1 hypothetical protein COCMIDRAFT_34980 [Bipolaris oryzae ATCC 44560]